MGVAAKIRILLIKRNMRLKDFAEKMGTSSSNISNKLTKDNFSEQEVKKIAEVLDCDYDITFTLRDSGETI